MEDLLPELQVISVDNKEDALQSCDVMMRKPRQ